MTRVKRLRVSYVGELMTYSGYAFVQLGPLKCTIEPTEGQSLNTTFNITCSAWNSPNSSPLTYEFGYTLQNGLRAILYQGNTNSFHTVLIRAISTIKTSIRDANRTLMEKELNVSVRII